jgi:predicted Rossmann-fold nucleotide-binding protein
LEDSQLFMVGKKYWKGLVDWIKKALIVEGMVSPVDMELFSVVDTPEEAVKVIEEFYSKYLLSPNF